MSQWSSLSRATIAKGLSDIQSDETGRSGFTKLQLNAMNISGLEGDLASYSALRYVDLNDNVITDLTPLERLYDLHSLQCADNKVKKLPNFSDALKLQVLDLAKNNITSLHPFNLPAVTALVMNNNKVLDLIGLESTRSPPPLRVLDLSSNVIEQTKGIENLTNLEMLNLRNNKIKSLDGFAALTNLRQLDVRDNQLTSMAELAHLSPLSGLRFLATTGNLGIHPEGSTPDTVVPELLILLPQLTHFNEIEITAEHREAADTLKAERDAEALAKATEEAAAAAVAADEAAAAAAAN